VVQELGAVGPGASNPNVGVTLAPFPSLPSQETSVLGAALGPRCRMCPFVFWMLRGSVSSGGGSRTVPSGTTLSSGLQERSFRPCLGKQTMSWQRWNVRWFLSVGYVY
jgi:hypothetical protein